MPKNKRPVPRKSSISVEEDDDVQAQALADLALDLSEQEHLDADSADPDALRLKEDEFAKLVRNALRKKNDEVLYGAIERARYTDVGAYQYVRGAIEEAAATLHLHREGTPALEVNAFALPMFVHSQGGLKEAEGFADGDAFDQLVASFKQAGLESPGASVVMLSHAYDLDEVDRITFSHLHEMLREAAASMTEKKLGKNPHANPALERSMAGWSDSGFGPDDQAVELRFLVGFALKQADDAFYQAPLDEAGADAYFDARMARYRDWTVQAAPLVARCLARQPERIEIHFLYQDLFFGAKEQGLEELAMLAMMSDVNEALQTHGAAPSTVSAIVGPADVDDQMVLRVNLYGDDGALLASSDKPLDLALDLQAAVDDIADALATIGIVRLSVALKFDHDGRPHEPRPYSPA